jgi:LPXTG-motif cell wall-anchored protein
MVFATLTLFQPLQVQAAPAGDVMRVELTNADAAIRVVADLVGGAEYTVSFWFRNDANNNEVQFQWVQGDWGGIVEGPSAPNTWVRHQETFTARASDFRMQLAPPHGQRQSGHVYYIGPVTFTSSSGATQTISLATMQEDTEWGVNMTILPNPYNPQTGDSFSSVWLIASGIGLAASLAVFGGVVAKKKRK